MSQSSERKGPLDWNARYAASPGSLYGDAPNQYLKMICARSDFAAHKALMLADGDGRNGTRLARPGLTVTAVDISKLATERALARDRAAGITSTRIAADLAGWSPPPTERYDAVFTFSLHCEIEIRAHAFSAAIGALAPGGWFVVEAFANTADRPFTIGLANQSLRYDLMELESVAAELDVVEAFTGKTLLHEGARHSGVDDVVRFAARQGNSLP